MHLGVATIDENWTGVAAIRPIIGFPKETRLKIAGILKWRDTRNDRGYHVVTNLSLKIDYFHILSKDTQKRPNRIRILKVKGYRGMGECKGQENL